MSVESATGTQHDPLMQEMPTTALPCAQPLMPSTRGPVLNVRWESSHREFQPGRDIVVGRDPQADIRIVSPLVSRAHLIMRFVDGRWVAIDNGSLNGMFVGGRRMSSVAITDGQTINIGEPGGPPMTFGIGQTERVTAPPFPVFPQRDHSPTIRGQAAGRAPEPKPTPRRRQATMPRNDDGRPYSRQRHRGRRRPGLTPSRHARADKRCHGNP